MEEIVGKKILITGGGGFIGTHIAERLCEKNLLILFDNLDRDSISNLTLARHPNVDLRIGDVLDAATVRQAASGVDIVLHLAAIAGVSRYYTIPLRTLRVNILGTLNALEASAAAEIERFVYFSTSEVFGANANGVTEDAPNAIGPTSDRRWVYATSKLAGENFVLRFGEEYGFAATCLRPFNIYGPRQTGEGAISNFCRAAVSGQPLEVYGDGKAVRAWCFVRDLVDAVVLALDSEDSAGHSFNIGNPDEVETSAGLARRVAALCPGASLRRREVDRADVAERVPCIDKARERLGFEPKVSLTQGLEETLRWFHGDTSA